MGKRKNYNLATPELMQALVKINATASLTDYRVVIDAKFVPVINPLLTGTKFSPVDRYKKHFAIYAKDVCCALLEINDSRSSYGHVDESKPQTQKTQIRVNKANLLLARYIRRFHKTLNAFTFSDGRTIRTCRCSVPFTTTAKTLNRFDRHRRHVLYGSKSFRGCLECEAEKGAK